MNMTPEMMVYYTKKMPGVLFEDKTSETGGRYTKVSWQGRSYTTINFTSIDDMVLKALQAPVETEPYAHTHSEEAAYDEYKTADGKVRLTVVTEKGTFKSLNIRLKAAENGTDKIHFLEVDCDDLDEVNNLLTALHAAVAGIHKRKDQ